MMMHATPYPMYANLHPCPEPHGHVHMHTPAQAQKQAYDQRAHHQQYERMTYASTTQTLPSYSIQATPTPIVSSAGRPNHLQHYQYSQTVRRNTSGDDHLLTQTSHIGSRHDLG
jgi:hypothetical protein